MVADAPPPDRDDYDRTDEEDEGWFPYTAPYMGLPLGPAWGRTDEPETYPEEETGYEADEDEGTWLDEGLITLLLVAGVVLFVFPEPATSGLGIVLIGLGVFAWIVDLLIPET